MANGNVGTPLWLTALAIFLSVVTTLLGILYQRQRSDITALRSEVLSLWLEASAFKAFKAMDTERDKNLERWRGQMEGECAALDRRVEEVKQADINWKHDKYGPRLQKIELTLARIKDKLGMPDRKDEE